MTMVGSVESFATDGWGVVRADDGSTHPFHCTALVDGTRRIEPGTQVGFELRPGRQGRWEAAGIVRR